MLLPARGTPYFGLAKLNTMIHIGKVTAYKQFIPQHMAKHRGKGKTQAEGNMISLKPVAKFQNRQIGLMYMFKQMVLFRGTGIRVPGKGKMGV
jgi:hypothetical protein